jgi:hypothetical protein
MLQGWLRMLREDNHFRMLEDADRNRFQTWEDFVQYREPFGLGMGAEIVDAILAEKDTSRTLKDVMDGVPDLAKRGRPIKGAEKGSVRTLKRGDNAEYQLARIKRDAPHVAVLIDQFPSVRAAARAAGVKAESRVYLGKPETVAERILAKGEDYARRVYAELGKALNVRL